MADTNACWLHTIGKALFNSEAGWVTPYKTACVAMPIELAMLELQWNGVLDHLYSLYMGRPPTCTMPTAGRRRHLAASFSQARPPIMTPSSQQAGPTIVGRALKSGSGTALDVGSPSSDTATNEMALDWQDVLGLHCAYLMLLVILAANKMVHKMVKAHRARARARAAPPSVPLSPSPSRDMEAGVEHHVDAAVAAAAWCHHNHAAVVPPISATHEGASHSIKAGLPAANSSTHGGTLTKEEAFDSIMAGLATCGFTTINDEMVRKVVESCVRRQREELLTKESGELVDHKRNLERQASRSAVRQARELIEHNRIEVRR
eukprot:6161645-Prymnesium_polylepis.2